MTFEPKSKDHAIVEVVFGVQLARPLAPDEMEALAKAHDRWRDDLPKLGRLPVFQISIGDAPGGLIPQPVQGVSFERVKPDGNLDWRLRADSTALFVNCLSYDGWENVWPKTARFFKDACEVALASDNAVQGLILQYLDVFEWVNAADKYAVDALLSRDSQYLPGSLWNQGPFWHLHQGWYRSGNLPVNGRILERIHLDAVVDETGQPTVKMDTFLNLELGPDAHITDPFGVASKHTDKLFNYLHDLNKDLVRAYINKDMAKRIGLDV